MGSFLEVNDTLQISTEQGFPSDILDLSKHLKEPITIEVVKDKLFSFSKKENARIFHRDPVRVFLVQNINGKWLFWGKALVQSQNISKVIDGKGYWIDEKWETSGTFIISEIYEPEYQKIVTLRESIKGKSYF